MEIKDKVLLNFIEEYLHLSFSTKKEVGEFFSELERLKGITFEEFVQDKDFGFKNNRKQDTAKFLKVIRESRYPVMTKAMNRVKGLSNSIKNKKIKVEYPENLEGNKFTLTIDIKSENDVEELIQHLEKRKEDMKKLIETIKNGG
jgi:uncharacterized protein YecA (UPF0149 family)